MSDSRLERAVRNEEFFRGANRAIVRDADGDEGLLEVLCECASLECTTRVRIAPDEWREAHERDLCFVVALGHVIPKVERVVRRERNYTVVEKFPPD